MNDDFLSIYLNYAKGTEVPTLFHRWAAIAGLGAWLEREFTFTHGHSIIAPNHYIMLIGASGTKKSTSIKMFKEILTLAGYETFAAEKTTKEKFLSDLAGEDTESDQSILDKNLWGDTDGELLEPAQCFIAADEFNDFFGNNILEFVSLLGSLWDYKGVYKNRLKNSNSILINNPTISILGGNTPVSFNSAFPPEILGQGFFSRLLLIYGEPTGVKITFPKTPAKEDKQYVVDSLRRVKLAARGRMNMTPLAESLLDKIYKSHVGIDDIRFDSYSNRRFTHLLKLCLIVCASRYSTVLQEEDVIYANTILSYAEHRMPRALGEFGKAKNSDVVHKVIQILDGATLPLSIVDIWKSVSTELDKIQDLSAILSNLTVADRIIATKSGFLLKRKLIDTDTSGTLDYGMLTELEQQEIVK